MCQALGILSRYSSEYNLVSVFKDFPVDCSVISASQVGNYKVVKEIVIKILSPE